MLPGYVGRYLAREAATTRGAVVRGVAAAAGALVVLGALGGALLAAGSALVSRLTLLEPVVVAVLFVLTAAMLAGRAPTLRVMLPERRASVAGFARLGAVYAAAGCVVPVFLGALTQALTLPPAATCSDTCRSSCS